jgi:hypothetical protein
MLPHLLHKTKCVIEPVDLEGTSYDEDAREEIDNMARKPTITISAQCEYRRGMQSRTGSDLQAVVAGGTNLEEFGYILVRVRDCASKGWTPAVGDRVAKMGRRLTDCYIMAIQPIAHYADQDGATLLRCYVQDRTPASVTKGPR